MAVLDPVQEFDEMVAPARAVAEQVLDVGQRLRIHHAALGLAAPAVETLDVDHLLADIRQRGLLAFMSALRAPSCGSAPGR